MLAEDDKAPGEVAAVDPANDFAGQNPTVPSVPTEQDSGFVDGLRLKDQNRAFTTGFVEILGRQLVCFH